MPPQPTLTLSDKREMPQLGFGTWKIPDGEAADIVTRAVEAGYRLIDTASIYGNEEGVGRGLARQAATDEHVWLTTKIWNTDQGYASALGALGESLDRLGTDSVDMTLIHWPCPDREMFVDTWKALIEMQREGRTRSIGVSNFREDDLKRLADATGKPPVVNQIELHPRFQQRELRAVHQEMGIVTQSWSPLGQGELLENKAIATIAEDTGAPRAAVILAWHLHHGLAPIPKASSRDHMEANLAALDLSLTDEQVAAIDDLDSENGRMGEHPDDTN
ncbi:aldo/keto reductase [Aurantiacibacter spongiae]|uniref:Aldo/keto reductase n=1 Tax=Aurantiacibacter spongiae TaxID=2488860 RepID=A0A3N5D8C2_9SPHN|nr:aldo/keto reductase [Aurantiacibacter spongiae]RPF70858.1 aldo/keto reductase [Aurantiacibacter spongiae]